MIMGYCTRLVSLAECIITVRASKKNCAVPFVVFVNTSTSVCNDMAFLYVSWKTLGSCLTCEATLFSDYLWTGSPLIRSRMVCPLKLISLVYPWAIYLTMVVSGYMCVCVRLCVRIYSVQWSSHVSSAASPSMRGSTPLDVAAASVMDNNELALALREPDLEKVWKRTLFSLSPPLHSSQSS